MALTLHYHYKNAIEKIFSFSVPAGSSPELVVGRPGDRPVDLDLSPDTQVSRPHARLYYDLNTWWVEDLASKRGTLLNGKIIEEATPLSPNDQLQMGNTFLQVEFEKHENDPVPGTIESELPLDETRPPIGIPEDKRIEILARISEIAGLLQGKAMLEGYLRELRQAFPLAQRMTILLVENRELVPCVFWPSDRSHVSFTLARQAMMSHTAFRWTRRSAPPVDRLGSLSDTHSALYAPLIYNGQAIGVIHIDSTRLQAEFNDTDLSLLSVIANTVGPAIKASSENFLHEYPSVFISYSHKDTTFVKQLAADLRRRRIKVWFDERLKGGAEWNKQILTAIGATDAFVLVLSPPSLASPYVKQEIDAAFSMNKSIFPILYQDCDLPEQLASIQYIDFRTRYDEHILDLVHELYDTSRPSAEPAATERESIRILFLAANPLNLTAPRLSEEVRTIDQCLRTAEFRNRFELLQHWGVQTSDLSETLLRHKPHIIHFSGHGSVDGNIILEDDNNQARAISVKTLARLLSAVNENLRCVVLNACLSEEDAKTLVQEIDSVVSAPKTVSDSAAVKFVGGFYRGLGYGRNLRTAFEIGCSEVELDDMTDGTSPKLWVRPGVDEFKITFA